MNEQPNSGVEAGAAQPVDVLIVTASVESLEAVMAIEAPGTPWVEQKAIQGFSFFEREVEREEGGRLKWALARLDGVRGEDNERKLQQMLTRLDPPQVVMCGGCFAKGIRASNGDLLIANQVKVWRDPTGLDVWIGQAGAFEDLYFLSAWTTDVGSYAKRFERSSTLGTLRPPSFEAQKAWVLHQLFRHLERSEDQFSGLDWEPSPEQHPQRREKCPHWTQVIQHLIEEDYIGTYDRRGYRAEEKARDWHVLHPDDDSVDRPFRAHFASIIDSAHINKGPNADAFGHAPHVALVAKSVLNSGRKLLFVFGIRDWVDDNTPELLHDFARKAAATFATSFLRRSAISRTEAQRLSLAPERAPIDVLRDSYGKDHPDLQQMIQRYRGLRLKQLRISGLRNIDTLDLDFSKPSSLKGFWTCIAGINGAGKSSVLQAIALVLLGEAYAPELGQELLKRARRRTEDNNKIKIMNASIEAEVQSEGRVTPLQLWIDEDGAHAASESPSLRKFWADRAKTHLLLAYGPGRNLSEYLDSRHESKRMQVRRIVTLFDPLAQVASADAILGHKEHDSSVLKLLTKLVEDVLQDFELSIVEYKKGLRFQMGKTMLSAVDLPDGFRSTLAWMADLCAGWAEMAPDVAKDGDPSTIQALVLIDEIDLHLHPKLQRVLVPRLRDALPLVQWVVTTHSPLVISSFDSHEIMMLKWDPETGVTRRELDRQVLGFSADEVYKWLMDTEPSSAEIEKIPLNGSPSQRERLAALLGMSPEFSAKDVEENKAFRQQRLG